jgi:hypothetical protein
LIRRHGSDPRKTQETSHRIFSALDALVSMPVARTAAIASGASAIWRLAQPRHLQVIDHGLLVAVLRVRGILSTTRRGPAEAMRRIARHVAPARRGVDARREGLEHGIDPRAFLAYSSSQAPFLVCSGRYVPNDGYARFGR